VTLTIAWVTFTIAVDLRDRPLAFRWTLIFVGCHKSERRLLQSTAFLAGRVD
jgi:hypothetical protein